MTDEQVAINIRKTLREKFPDTVFQVSYVNRKFDVCAVGGKLKFEGFTDTGIEEEILGVIYDAIYSVEEDLKKL